MWVTRHRLLYMTIHTRAMLMNITTGDTFPAFGPVMRPANKFSPTSILNYVAFSLTKMPLKKT